MSLESQEQETLQTIDVSTHEDVVRLLSAIVANEIHAYSNSDRDSQEYFLGYVLHKIIASYVPESKSGLYADTINDYIRKAIVEGATIDFEAIEP